MICRTLLAGKLLKLRNYIFYHNINSKMYLFFRKFYQHIFPYKLEISNFLNSYKLMALLIFNFIYSLVGS